MGIFIIFLKREVKKLLPWMIILLTVSLLTGYLLSAFLNNLQAKRKVAAAPEDKSDTQNSSDEENGESTWDIVAYSVSVTEGDMDPFFINFAKSELKKFPFIKNVYIESEAEALARLAAGETLFAMLIPEDFMADVSSGGVPQAAQLHLNPHMPEESRQVGFLFKNLFSSLNQMNHAAIVWRNMYSEYTGDDAASWVEISKLALNQLRNFINRDSVLKMEDSSSFMNPGAIMATFILVFSVLAVFLLIDRRMQVKHSSFQERILQQGHKAKQTWAMIWAHFLLFLILLLPFFYLLNRVYPFNLTGSIALQALAGFFTSIFLALCLTALSEKREKTLAISWLAFLLFLFLAGAVTPQELFPKPLQMLVHYTPWHGYYQAMSDILGLPFTSRNIGDSIYIPQTTVNFLLPILLSAAMSLLLEKRKEYS